MSFTWTHTASSGLAILNQYMIEMQTNIDHIYDQQTPPHTKWTWVENPTGEGPGIGAENETDDWQEMRDALDHIVDNLSCSSHNATYDATVCPGHLNVKNATKYDTFWGAHLDTVESTKLALADPGQFSGYNGPHKNAVYPGACGSNCPSHCPYTNTNGNIAVKTSFCAPHYNTQTENVHDGLCAAHVF